MEGKFEMSEYPRCKQIGVSVIEHPIHHVNRQELNECLVKAGLNPETYSELYGVQTQILEGPYAWDVEAVLERMMSGKLTGTQLLWD
jgi:hypothetical protein